MINSENLTNRPAFQYKNVTGKLTTEFYGKVSTKLVRAGSLLQGTLAIRKANLVEKKKIREGQKRDRFEDRLEANPNVEKNKNFINRIPRPGSGVGILGWFKNFIGSVALGFFATKLLGSLPLFQGILKGVLGVADFVASTGVFLVNAITTFIDIGYKAYDSTAGFLKAIGGDNAITIFDTFTDRLSSLIDVLIVASIVRGGGLGLGIGGPGGRLGIGSSAAREARARKQEEIRAAKDALDAKKGPKPKAKPVKGGGAGAVAGTIAEGGQKKRDEFLKKRNERIDKSIQKLEEERIRKEQIRIEEENKRRKLLRSTTAFRQRQKSIKGISIENRKKLARAARVRRQRELLSSNAGRRAYELDAFLGQGGITTDPEYKLFKRINALDRVIEKNQVEGNSAAARRNIKERDILFKKLQKGQTLRQRGGRVTPVEGIGKVKRLIRRRADTAFLTGLEPDPKLMGKAFTDAQADFDADQEAGIRGGRVARDTSGMSRLDRAVSRVPVGVTARGLNRIPDRLIIKLFGKNVRRMAGRLPIIGGLVDFGISLLEGDPIPKALTRAIFAGIGGGVGAFLGSLTGPFAPIAAPLGALLVGGLADSLGSFLYDSVIKGFFPGSKTNAQDENILSSFLKPLGGIWERINQIIFGKPDPFRDLDPFGGFVEKKPGDTKPQPQPQPTPRAGSKGIPLPPRDTSRDVDVSGFKLPKDVAGDKDFIAGINRLAKKYQISPNDLLSVIAFETGGSFSPSQKNLAGSGATGLIQFMPSTAKGLGTTTEDLAKMSRSEQLKFVDKYFSNKGIKGGSLSDLYMSVLFPVAVGKPDSFVLFGRGALPGYTGRAYDQNRGLDLNNDGSITKGEASFKVIQTKKRYEDIKKNASYDQSDSTVVVNSSQIAKLVPVPIPDNNNVPVIASSGGDGYDPFQSTYKIG